MILKSTVFLNTSDIQNLFSHLFTTVLETWVPVKARWR